jgi:hypothetical protein
VVLSAFEPEGLEYNEFLQSTRQPGTPVATEKEAMSASTL